MPRKLFIAGNWKMNKTATEAHEAVAKFVKLVADLKDKLRIAVCPPFTSIDRIAPVLRGTNVELGAQNMSDKASGAYTGEVSASMLLDLGVKYVIVGHSERRQFFHETDSIVNTKAKFALLSGLLPIVCIGETLEEREAGRTNDVIVRQVKGSFADMTKEELIRTTVAYEPVWAIGTGRTASPQQAQDVHALIRRLFAESHGADVAEKVIIQYGGSVKASNSKELMAMQDIDGALVGGASLNPAEFAELISNAVK